MADRFNLGKRAEVRYPYFDTPVMYVIRFDDGSLSLVGRFTDGTLAFMNWRHDGKSANGEIDVASGNNEVKILASSYGDGDMGVSRMINDFMDSVLAHCEHRITERDHTTGSIRLRLSRNADTRTLERVAKAGDTGFLPRGYFTVSDLKWVSTDDASIYCYGVAKDDDVAIGIVNALSVIFARCSVVYRYKHVVKMNWGPYESQTVKAGAYPDHYEILADIAVRVGKITGYSPKQINTIVFDDLCLAFGYAPASDKNGLTWYNRGFYDTGTKICFTRNCVMENEDE